MQNHFTIIIDACNQEKWIEKCLNTCITQKYDNYEVILIDAISTDQTFEIAKKYEQEFSNFKAYQNEVRLPQVANFLKLTKLSKPGTICVSVDGDDWLKHSKVLEKLNEVYNSGDIFLTYGTYTEYYGDDKPMRDSSWHYHAYPEEVIKNNSFREHTWLGSHLRTWRRELFLKINENDFKEENGNWLFTAGDQAGMLPMLEMAGHRSRYIKDILYVYNSSDQMRDSSLNEQRQIELANYVRSKKKYNLLETI